MSKINQIKVGNELYDIEDKDKANISHTHTKSEITDFEEYKLPTASAETLGGVKVGAGLKIDDGVLSATGGGTADSIDWEDVQNKPTIPSKTSELINDSSYATENYVKNEIANAQLGGGDVEIDLSGYATKDELPTKTSDLTNDSGFISSIPSEYITETELEDKGYLTEHQSLEDYALKNEIPSIAGLASETYVTEYAQPKGNYLTSIPDEYITETELNNAISDKANKNEIPINNNQLINGAGYQTASEVTNAIGSAISDIQGISYSVVETLPETGEAGFIYLINNDGERPNIYDEYIWVNETFEKIGTTEIDLSDYVLKDNLRTINNVSLVGSGDIKVGIYTGTSEVEATTSGATIWVNPEETSNPELVTTSSFKSYFDEFNGLDLLWEASTTAEQLAKGGSVTIPTIQNYKLLLLIIADIQNPCLVHSTGTAFGGGGVYLSGGNAVISRAVAGTISGTTLTYTATYIYNADGGTHASSSAKISAIYGIPTK